MRLLTGRICRERIQQQSGGVLPLLWLRRVHDVRGLPHSLIRIERAIDARRKGGHTMKDAMEHPALTESGENYLEAILKLEQHPGDAVRSVDVAATMSVSRASVSKAMHQLRETGLVDFDPYGLIGLTESGRKIANEILERHEMLRRFLTQVLGVEASVADAEACRMEHAISQSTKQKWMAYLRKIL